MEVDGLTVFHPGDHGSTFGGNPLGCAVAREAMKVLIDENMVQLSADNGAYFLKKLRTVDSKHVKEIRGRGLWIGIELDCKARPYCEALWERGLLCKETHENVIRFAPPLTISKRELNMALRRINKVFKKLG